MGIRSTHIHANPRVCLSLSLFSLPNRMQITDPGKLFFFSGSCLTFFTHIPFPFLNSEFLKTLAQGHMSLQKATKASLVPWKVQVFQSPFGSLLQKGCSVVWRGPSALRKSELAWGRPPLSYPQTSAVRNALHISMCQNSNKRLQGTENMKNSPGSEP